MRKPNYEFKCGHRSEIEPDSKLNDTLRRFPKLKPKNMLCPDCYKEASKKMRDDENSAAAKANAEAGLLPLIGTEKQIAWAELIRKQKISSLKETFNEKFVCTVIFPNQTKRLGMTAFNKKDPRLWAAIESLSNRQSACWWIDSRQSTAIELLEEEYKAIDTPLSIEEQKIEKEARKEALAEATVYPERSCTNTVAEIHIIENNSRKFIEVSFAEKREDFRKLIKFKLHYLWNGTCWQREIGEITGTVSDRVAETGHGLLAEGFPIRIFDGDLRDKAIKGEFIPEHRRWIITGYDEKYIWFVIRWNFDDDCYNAAKIITGSRYRKPFIVVPPEQFDEVIDFAEMHQFRFSDKAKELTETGRKIKENAIFVKVSRKNNTLKIISSVPQKLNVSNNVQVAEKFKDEEVA